jgi:hypothetical protein
MTTQTMLRIRARATLQRAVAIGMLLLPLILAACSGDNSGGGGGGAGGY